jgi:hypothetical protein
MMHLSTVNLRNIDCAQTGEGQDTVATQNHHTPQCGFPMCHANKPLGAAHGLQSRTVHVSYHFVTREAFRRNIQVVANKDANSRAPRLVSLMDATRPESWFIVTGGKRIQVGSWDMSSRLAVKLQAVDLG